VLARYRYLVVRDGDEDYVLPIPAADSAIVVPALDLSGEAIQIVKSTLGPVEWKGTALDRIVAATLHKPPLTPVQGQDGKPVSAGAAAPADFVVSSDGTRVQVFFSDGSTDAFGKAEVEFTTSAGPPLRAPLFILKAPAGG
jgi:hypothetical protein